MPGMPTWLKIGIPVVALPLFALGALAAIGARIAASQEEGPRVDSPEVVRARIVAARRAFNALSPAQHLDAARAAMATGFDGTRGVGGDFCLADQHLAALPPGAPWADDVTALHTEMAARRTRALPLVASTLHAEVQRAGEGEINSCRRRDVACRLSHLPVEGQFTAMGTDGTVLRWENPQCSSALLDTMVPPARRAELRVLGFQRVECAGPQGVLTAGL